MVESRPSPDDLRDYLLGQASESKAAAIESYLLLEHSDDAVDLATIDSKDDFLAILRQAQSPSDDVEVVNKLVQTIREFNLSPIESLKPSEEDQILVEELNGLTPHRLLEPTGSGAATLAYKAQSADGTRLVIKFLKPQLAKAPALKMHFYHSSSLARQIADPRIARIDNVDCSDDLPHLTMEFLEGQSLSRSLQAGRAARIRDVLRIVRDVASALAAAHRHGLIHGRLTPNNVWVPPSGSLKVMDFGLIPATTAESFPAVEIASFYVAPEVYTGICDPRSDLYSLGAVLVNLVLGRQPRDGEVSASATLAALVASNAEPLERGAQAICKLAEKLLAEDPNERFENADQVIDAVDAIEASLPRQSLLQQMFARPFHWIAFVVFAVFVATVAVFWAVFGR